MPLLVGLFLTMLIFIFLVVRYMYWLSVAAGPPWGSARDLSLSAHTAGGPPPLLAPGRVVSARHTLGVKLILLGRRCCGDQVVFNHLRESLIPSLHTGGPRRGRSFRRRLRRWRRWHGSRSVEMTSYLYVVASEYVTARLRQHERASATPRGSGYGDTSSFGFS
jgi:hypothetical protein